MYANMWSNTMYPKVYNPPPFGWMKTLYINLDKNRISQIIGKEGIVFKAITHQTPDVNYIWYNSNTRCIEIYGNNIFSIDIAYNKLLKRIAKFL